MASKSEHDYTNNGLGAEVCRKCGHVMRNPDWPLTCPSKSSEPVSKEQFQKYVEPYAAERAKGAFHDGYARGYFDCAQGYGNRHDHNPEALPNPTSSGNDKLPQPNLPVESLEDNILSILWDVAGPDTSGKLEVVSHAKTDLTALIESEKQKARIKELEKMRDEWGYGEWDKASLDWEDYITDRLKELREER